MRLLETRADLLRRLRGAGACRTRSPLRRLQVARSVSQRTELLHGQPNLEVVVCHAVVRGAGEKQCEIARRVRDSRAPRLGSLREVELLGLRHVQDRYPVSDPANRPRGPAALRTSRSGAWRMLDLAMRARSFPPVIGLAPKVLILGSMPGRASLAAVQYYAHRQNSFWRIIDALGIAEAGLAYEARLGELKQARIALWDVLAACERSGSLDASIVASSEVPNDVTGLLADHPSLHAVLFNGTKAEAAFRKHILPALPAAVNARLDFVRLPSTSPARAIPFEAKLAAWREALAATLEAA
jgi:double-stranded uracil-DNA glycosylase